MKSDPLMEQVTGILIRAQISFDFLEDGNEIGLSTEKTVIYMRPREVAGTRFLHIEADLAVDIEMTQEVAAGVYVWLNQRNSEELLARFVLHEAPRQEGEVQRAWVSAEWELAGINLEGSQLLRSVEILADRAGSLADSFVQVFGGRTPLDIRAERDAFHEGGPDSGFAAD